MQENLPFSYSIICNNKIQKSLVRYIMVHPNNKWYAYVKKNVINLYVLILKTAQDIISEKSKYSTVCLYTVCVKQTKYIWVGLHIKFALVLFWSWVLGWVCFLFLSIYLFIWHIEREFLKGILLGSKAREGKSLPHILSAFSICFIF